MDLPEAHRPPLRPPTISGTQPEALKKLRFQNTKAAGHSRFSYELSFDGDVDQADDDLARALWFALGGVFVMAGAEGNQDISFIVADSVCSNTKLLQALEDVGATGESQPFRFDRARWYQGWPVYAYDNRLSQGEAGDGAAAKRHPSKLIISPNGSLIPPKQSTLPAPPQPFYERYIAHLDTYLCLSVFGNTETDIDLLHGWLNDPRVDQFWQDAGTREHHVKWLEGRYEDSHKIPVLGSYRGTGGNSSIIEPFAYYEIYWAADDKIGTLYSVDPYDRGIHMLVGSSAHRGPHRVKSWLPSLVHYIFTDDPRTQRVISEPNHLNLKMIKYLESFGFKNSGEVDMGHKIAALMILDRGEFWKRCPL